MGWQAYAGFAVVVLALVVWFVQERLGKAPLSGLPLQGPLPLGDLTKYYDLEGDALAWESGGGP